MRWDRACMCSILPAHGDTFRTTSCCRSGTHAKSHSHWRAQMNHHITRRGFLAYAGLGAGMLALPRFAFARRAQQKPNVLWITIEDAGCQLGCYGDTAAKTPFLDQFSQECVRFTNAYSSSGVCGPSRSCVAGGMFPATMGADHFHCRARVPTGMKLYPEYLRDGGYYCTNNEKNDFQFDFDWVGVWDRNSTDDFLWRTRPGQTPFFHVRNYMDTHEGRYRYNRIGYLSITDHKPEDMPVPPYFPDTPKVRRCLTGYYQQMTLVDGYIRDLIQELKNDGLYEDTIIFFFSDNGGPMPRQKRWCYDSGLRIPLMIRIPEKFRRPGQGAPGSVDDQLISFCDFAPTLLNLCSLPNETVNLVDSSESAHRQALQRLRAEHIRWIRESSDVLFIPEATLRQWAAQYGSEYAVIEALGNDRQGAWLAAVEQAEEGLAGMAGMIASLDDTDPVVRYWSCQGLGNIGPDAALSESKLTTLLNDPNKDVRIAAARALMLMDKPTQAIEAFKLLAADNDAAVRLLALNEIEWLGYRSMPLLDTLQARLNAEKFNDAYKALTSAIETIPVAVTARRGKQIDMQQVGYAMHLRGTQLRITFAQPFSGGIRIFNAGGKQCCAEKVSGSRQAAIDTGAFARGWYTVRMYGKHAGREAIFSGPFLLE
ncbi:MAG: sulfatase-like hydrolase/transferase [Chitinivibrionales bacterium]|nr:sulfatase-like hydrolase/transferase [Chitinivibrionales bacterium]